jgi:hypothetical protein
MLGIPDHQFRQGKLLQPLTDDRFGGFRHENIVSQGKQYGNKLFS